MAVILSYDISDAEPVQHNHIQSMFERLGWQNLGGSSYRYPRLGEKPFAEDWLNHVIPALMLFRAYVIDSGKPLTKFSLDVQSSTGYLPSRKFGTAPKDSTEIKFYPPSNKSFGLKKLKQWIDSVRFPY